MNVYVFGNEYVAEDNSAVEVARALENTVEGISFVFVGPNDDVPFAGEPRAVILDSVQGISEVALVEGVETAKLVLSPRGSVHDFDLAFQLRYLKKLGKLGDVTVIGIPQEGEVDHLLIKSTYRYVLANSKRWVPSLVSRARNINSGVLRVCIFERRRSLSTGVRERCFSAVGLPFYGVF